MSDPMNPEAPVRLLLVDDHTILRQGLAQLLEGEGRLEICGESDNGEDAILKAITLKPDVILLDINLPKVSGYEASRAILAAWPDVRIVVLTNQDDVHVLRRFMELGIRAYLLKDIQADQLVETILRVHFGETIDLAPELAEKLNNLKAAGRGQSAFTLTEREREVLAALAKGYSNQQLAELLMVSQKTVHNHLYHIYDKIGVKTRAEAIVWAIESGFSD